MEKFKRKLRIRTVWIAVVIICVAVTNFALIINHKRLPVLPDFIYGFQTGIFAGLELILLFILGKNITAMKTDVALKKLYIQEHDERKLMIKQKTGSIGFEIYTIGICFAIIVSGFFNQTVFFTLLGVTVFIEFIQFFLKIYYTKKF